MSARLRLYIAKGEDKTFAGIHTQGPGDMTPVDISGWTIAVVIKNRDGSAFQTVTATIVDGQNGSYTWTVTHAQSNVVTEIKPFDIWRTDANAETLMAGGRDQRGNPTAVLVFAGDEKYGS